MCHDVACLKLNSKCGVQAEKVLDGQWKLVYTSNSELFALLALSRLPFVSVGDITQKIEASTFTVENKACLLHTLSYYSADKNKHGSFMHALLQLPTRQCILVFSWLLHICS